MTNCNLNGLIALDTNTERNTFHKSTSVHTTPDDDDDVDVLYDEFVLLTFCRFRRQRTCSKQYGSAASKPVTCESIEEFQETVIKLNGNYCN